MLSVEDYILDAGAVHVLQFVFIHDLFCREVWSLIGDIYSINIHSCILILIKYKSYGYWIRC